MEDLNNVIEFFEICLAHMLKLGDFNGHKNGLGCHTDNHERYNGPFTMVIEHLNC